MSVWYGLVWLDLRLRASSYQNTPKNSGHNHSTHTIYTLKRNSRPNKTNTHRNTLRFGSHNTDRKRNKATIAYMGMSKGGKVKFPYHMRQDSLVTQTFICSVVIISTYIQAYATWHSGKRICFYTRWHIHIDPVNILLRIRVEIRSFSYYVGCCNAFFLSFVLFVVVVVVVLFVFSMLSMRVPNQKPSQIE